MRKSGFIIFMVRKWIFGFTSEKINMNFFGSLIHLQSI